jgi:hypothetical protein
VTDTKRVEKRTHFWYRLISRRATVPGLYLWGFLTPPVAAPADLEAVFRAALVATNDQYDIQAWDIGGIDNSRCFRGAFPPVDFRAVCLVRAIVTGGQWLLDGLRKGSLTKEGWLVGEGREG